MDGRKSVGRSKRYAGTCTRLVRTPGGGPEPRSVFFANQTKILANQGKLEANQAKLLYNQEKILSNQEKILAKK
jgi:hypothetical protein